MWQYLRTADDRPSKTLYRSLVPVWAQQYNSLEKGDLPPKVAEWPGASIPINLSLSLEEQNALTHIQGLIRNYQVEALPESEDSSSGFLSDGTSHDVGMPSASDSD